MKNKTQFIRVKKNKNYSVMNNKFLKKDTLSWKAKGILAYILHLPDDWSINLKEVMTHATEGERAFRSGWKELEDHGYVERHPVREGQRIKHWKTIVSEEPILNSHSLDSQNSKVEKDINTLGFSEHCGFEDVRSEDVGFEDVQNGKLLSTKDTKYLNTLNTNNTNKEHSPAKAEPNIPYKEIIEYLNDAADRNYRHTTRKTKDLIKARANEGFTFDDFKEVIDTKVDEWKSDSNMSKYLRPETLFGTKFESYLNQPNKRKDTGGFDPNDQYRNLYSN